MVQYKMVRAHEPTKQELERKKALISDPEIIKAQAERLASADFYYVLSPDAISSMLKMSKAHASKLRRMTVYRDRMEALRQRMNEGMDKALAEDSKKMKMRMQDMVPKALETLADHLEKDGDMLSLQAAKEVLDRDGRMPKTSRVQTQTQPASKIPSANDAILEEFGVQPKPDTVN